MAGILLEPPRLLIVNAVLGDQQICIPRGRQRIALTLGRGERVLDYTNGSHEPELSTTKDKLTALGYDRLEPFNGGFYVFTAIEGA